MKLHLDDHRHNQIQSYDLHNITINGKIYTHSLVITPQSLKHWEIESFNQLTVHHFAEVITSNPEIVLLGTGQKMQFPVLELLAPLINQNIGFEVMNTPAACRTYNLLVAEGRQVVAMLLL